MEPSEKVNGGILVKYYYDTLISKHYKPIYCGARDGAWAKKFLASGRTFEDFKKLLGKALVGPRKIQIAVCSGLHSFMAFLPEIELLDSAPWEPSEAERAANVKLIETATIKLAEKFTGHKVKDRRDGWHMENGKWVKA